MSTSTTRVLHLRWSLGLGGVVVDPGRGTLRRWWGPGVPLLGPARELSMFSRVVMTRETRPSAGDARSYRVRIEGSEHTVLLPALADHHRARGNAEALAKAMRLPLVDDSSGTKVIRQPDELDLSLRARLAARGEAVPEPGPPPGGIVAEDGPDGARLSLPRRGVFGAFRKETLTLLAAGVSWTMQGVVREHHTSLDVDDVEEVELVRSTRGVGAVVPGEVVAIRSDSSAIEVGAGCTHEELEWLQRAVRHHLAGSSSSPEPRPPEPASAERD